MRRRNEAYPDFCITIENMVNERDPVALRGTVRTERVSRVIWFVRLADGKMREMWTGVEISKEVFSLSTKG